MVLSASWTRWRYDYAIERVERAYRAARQALDKKAESLAEDFKSADSTDEEHEGYKDHLVDQYHIAEESLTLVRESFALAMHHLWEKNAKDWAEQNRYQYKSAYKKIVAKGYSIDKSGLEKLRKTANTIKHNSDELFRQYKSMFDKIVAQDLKDGHEVDYQDALRLTDDDLEGFLKALKSSGPPVKKLTSIKSKESAPT